MTIDQFFAFAEDTVRRCREAGHAALTQELDEALSLGSSGLEILGALKKVYVAHFVWLAGVVDETALREAIAFVDSAFGSRFDRRLGQ